MKLYKFLIFHEFLNEKPLNLNLYNFIFILNLKDFLNFFLLNETTTLVEFFNNALKFCKKKVNKQTKI